VSVTVTLFSSCRFVYVSSVGVLFSSVSVPCNALCVGGSMLVLNLTYGFLFELVSLKKLCCCLEFEKGRKGSLGKKRIRI